MDKQLIISVGREYGSGGHVIAQRLADRYGLPLYDRNLLKELAAKKNLNAEELEAFDEVKRNRFLSRTVKSMNSSPEYNVAALQFEYLKEKAEKGESFVIVGRCAETILREYPAMISIFVLGDREAKVERIMRIYGKHRSEAERKCDEIDKARKQYHNSYCKVKWGDSRNYDISINSSRLGIDRTVGILSQYIDERRK